MGLYLGSGEKLKFITDNGSTNVVKYLPHIKHVNTDTGGDTGENLTGKYIWNIYTNANKALQIGKASSDNYNKYPIIGSYTDGFYYVMQNALFDVFEVDTITHTNYAEIEGTSKSFSSSNSSYTKKAASAYTIQNGKFVLTSPTTKKFSNIAAGDYLVNVSTSSNTATSGATLYKVEKVEITYTEKKTFINSYGVWGTGYYGATSITFTSDGKIILGKAPTNYNVIFDSVYRDKLWQGTGSDYYPNETFTYTPGTYDKVYYYDDSNTVSDGSGTLDVYEVTALANYKITYTPYTLSVSSTSTSTEKGSLVETISASAESYPKDGIQGDYWYVLRNSDIE